VNPYRTALRAALLASLLAGAACSRPSREESGTSAAVAPAATPSAGASAAPLVPATAALESVDSLALNPANDSLAADSVLVAQARRGLQLFLHTKEELPQAVGNQLSCGNCHLNAGQKDRALPLVGVAAIFPDYRARSGRLVSLEGRIRGCFQRSLNGTAPDEGSPELLALSAYITWISRGQPMGTAPAWRGKNAIAREKRIPVAQLDTAQGKALFAQKCAVCHGADGQGVDLGTAKPGPLWGRGSWNDGAGMSRVYTLAGYLRYAMPLTAPGTLTDEEAQQIAAYVNSQERPVYPGKAKDYPDGAVPVDAVYYPKRGSVR
jgi:thiosulfate dehydrogenase